jgi:hypothetical protein
MVDEVIGQKLNSLFDRSLIVSSVPKKLVYISLPYIGYYQNRFLRNEFNTLIKRHYPQLDLKLIFKNNFSIDSFFRVKDRMPALLQSNVVYEFKCSQCQATYCGETTRHLQSRIAEHKGLSVRTGRTLSSPPYSAIREHSLSNDHPIRNDSFKIVAQTDKHWVRTLESIVIHRLSPSLNDSAASVPLHILG